MTVHASLIRILLAAALGAPLLAAAAPACVDTALFAPAERGVGGTGSPASGMGGTGAPLAGIGGTGAPASGLGGTGAPMAGVGGTGSPATGIGGTGAMAAGVGGTGAVAAGVGGTGAPAGGIGGTGAIAESGMGGTGIVGTITGFASICVNGLEVHYDEATPMTENGQPADLRRLAVGQVVAIDATPSARGLEARKVVIMHALAGPVTRNDGDRMTVMGQPVRFASDAARASARAVPAGAQVRVSGLRDADGSVVASRVERADDLAEHSVVGEVHRGGIDGLAVSGRPLPARGTEALARGRWSGRELVAREIAADPGRPFAGRADRLVVEARIRVDDGRRRAAGFELRGDAAGEIEALRAGTLVRVSGRTDGRNGLRIERIERAREDAADDRRRGRGGDVSRSDDSDGTDDKRSGRQEDADRDNREDRSGPDDSGRREDSRDSGREDRSGSDSGREPRIERERGDRERVERIERSGRDDRPDRIEVDRSGRG